MVKGESRVGTAEIEFWEMVLRPWVSFTLSPAPSRTLSVSLDKSQLLVVDAYSSLFLNWISMLYGEKTLRG